MPEDAVKGYLLGLREKYRGFQTTDAAERLVVSILNLHNIRSVDEFHYVKRLETAYKDERLMRLKGLALAAGENPCNYFWITPPSNPELSEAFDTLRKYFKIFEQADIDKKLDEARDFLTE